MNIDIEAIKARLAAATPGPWQECAESGQWWIENEDGTVVGDITEGWNAADMAFVTHAPADIAALLAALAAAGRERDEWHKLSDDWMLKAHESMLPNAALNIAKQERDAARAEAAAACASDPCNPCPSK